MDFQKNCDFYGENRGRGRAILTPNELVLTFGDLHLCVQFGENRQRNATMRVTTHGQTHTHTQRRMDRQTQTDFIICPMLYAIAMGQINMQKVVIVCFIYCLTIICCVQSVCVHVAVTICCPTALLLHPDSHS